jgi:hypothetical protein
MFLSINSIDRTASSVSSNDFQIKIPHDLPDVKTVELVSCIMPNSVYKIRTGVNDKLDFNDGANKTITVTPGAYSITSLCSNLLTQFNTLSSGFTAVSYDTITMRVTITRSSNFSLLFATGSNIATSIRKELGFNATNISATTTYTGQNIINLYNPLGCYICINEFGMPNRTSAGTFYTFHIPMSVNSDGLVVVEKNSFYKQQVDMYNNKSVSTLTIKLKMADGTDFALNNTNFELVLKFK